LLLHETLLPITHPEVGQLSAASTLIRARSRFRDWKSGWRASGAFGAPPDRSIVVENRAQAKDAAVAGAEIAVMDRAYAAPHLTAGRLRALVATIQLSHAYNFVGFNRIACNECASLYPAIVDAVSYVKSTILAQLNLDRPK